MWIFVATHYFLHLFLSKLPIFFKKSDLPIFLRGLLNILQHQPLAHWKESMEEHYMAADLLCIAIAGLTLV